MQILDKVLGPVEAKASIVGGKLVLELDVGLSALIEEARVALDAKVPAVLEPVVDGAAKLAEAEVQG